MSKVIFNSAQASIERSVIQEIGRELEINLPETLINQYMISNGGEPEPYVYSDSIIDTVISEFLPLVGGDGTAVTCYRKLVLEQKIVPVSFFPFAVDGGGDYFFCDTISGEVYFFSSDSTVGHRLISLGMNVEEFFEKLTWE